MRKKLLIGLAVLLGLCLLVFILAPSPEPASAPAVPAATATTAPSSTPTPSATPQSPAQPAATSDAGARLADHLTNTACSADLGADMAPWCSKIRGASIVIDTVTIRAEVTPAEAEDMGRVLSAFVFNNQNTDLGLSKIRIYNESDGALLYERLGL